MPHEIGASTVVNAGGPARIIFMFIILMLRFLMSTGRASVGVVAARSIRHRRPHRGPVAGGATRPRLVADRGHRPGVAAVAADRPSAGRELRPLRPRELDVRRARHAAARRRSPTSCRPASSSASRWSPPARSRTASTGSPPAASSSGSARTGPPQGDRAPDAGRPRPRRRGRRRPHGHRGGDPRRPLRPPAPRPRRPPAHRPRSRSATGSPARVAAQNAACIAATISAWSFVTVSNCANESNGMLPIATITTNSRPLSPTT